MKRLATWGGFVLATWVLLELAAVLLFQRISGLPLDLEQIAAIPAREIEQLDAILDRGATSDLSVIPHPYLGYVNRPGIEVGIPGVDPPPHANGYGFVSRHEDDFPSRHGSDELVIAVLGGSAAEIFAGTQAATLEHELRRLDPRFDRRVKLVCLAAGGFKQPQQLFLLQYALLMGFEFDAVVNLDGFNDLVFAVENAGSQVHPIFPSAYHTATLLQLQLRGILDPVNVAKAERFYSALRGQRWVLALAQQAPLRWSPFANLAAVSLGQHLAARASRFRFQAARRAGDALAPELRGPRRPWPEDPQRMAAELWAGSSRMIAAICATFGLPYVHLLQPNQYVDNSKIFTETELRVAVRPDHPWGSLAREGYPELQKQGRRLREEGIAFYDMTLIFRDRSESIYIDDCCHFGPLGNRILATHLAGILQRELGESLLASPGSPR